MRVIDIVKAEPALDAETVFVGRAAGAVDLLDLAVFDLERQLATDAAIGADRLDLFVIIGAVAALVSVNRRCGHQRAGRAGLHAFAAGDAGRCAHRVHDVEDDLGVAAPAAHADHVVHLNFTAGADAEVTVDAGVQIDLHRHMAVIQQGDAVSLNRRKAAVRDALRIRHGPEVRGPVMRLIAFRLVSDQQLHHHGAGLLRSLAGGVHNHAFGRLTHAGRRQSTFALDLYHAGAAIAV